MGIKINVQTRNDYSYLFRSMNQNNDISGTNFLSDYASIKNGSYGRLLKAYYAENSSEEVKKLSANKVSLVSKEGSENLAKVQKSAAELKKDVDTLSASGRDSVWESEDKEAISKAVDSFVENYNSLMKSGESSFSASVQSRTQVMENTVNANARKLAKAGITVNMDKTLTINKEQFEKASGEDIKALFQGNNSLGSRVSSQAQLISKAAEQETSKANTYTATGNYGNSYNVGNLFQSIF